MDGRKEVRHNRSTYLYGFKKHMSVLVERMYACMEPDESKVVRCVLKSMKYKQWMEFKWMSTFNVIFPGFPEPVLSYKLLLFLLSSQSVIHATFPFASTDPFFIVNICSH